MSKRKVLLLHGWDWKKYPKFKPSHQWENRQEFLDLLRKYFELDFPTMPGFNVHDSYVKEWTLDDYAVWLKEKVEKNSYDAIIGYSFGCAALVHYLYKFNAAIPAMCISPAIVRAYAKTPKFKIPNVFLRNLYLRFVVKNPYFIHGNTFLRKTYNNIVRVDLSNECTEVCNRGNKIHFIFGEKDTATPYALFISKVPEAKDITRIIQNGTHDIGGTHPKRVVDEILASLS